MFQRYWEQNQNEGTEQENIRKSEFLAVAEACEAVFWPTLGFQVETLDSPWLPAEGTLSSVHPRCPAGGGGRGRNPRAVFSTTITTTTKKGKIFYLLIFFLLAHYHFESSI